MRTSILALLGLICSGLETTSAQASPQPALSPESLKPPPNTTTEVLALATQSPLAPSSSKATRAAWWQSFGAPELDLLVQTALHNHTDISRGLNRIAEADALVDQALSARLPTANFSGSVGYSRNISAFGTTEGTSVNGNLPIRYSVNLWGRYMRSHQAAKDDLQAARWDQAALRLALSARVVEGWLGYQAAGRRLAIRLAQQKRNQRRFKLINARVAAGLAPELDRLREEQNHARGQVAVQLAQEDLALQAMALRRLMGVPDHPLSTPNFVVGSSADLLKTNRLKQPSLIPNNPAATIAQRPDIQAARARISAADQRVGEAVAARFPELRLELNPGFTWQQNEIAGGNFGSNGPTEASGFSLMSNATLNLPLFEGFRGQGEMQASRARLKRAVSALEGLVVNALIQLRQAQLQETRARLELTGLELQLQLARKTLQKAQARYRAGVDDLSTVLDAVASEQQTELQAVAAHQQLMLSRVATYQALGGAPLP